MLGLGSVFGAAAEAPAANPSSQGRAAIIPRAVLDILLLSFIIVLWVEEYWWDLRPMEAYFRLSPAVGPGRSPRKM
jgi:hypothetical protein